jgi:hypothetical protein
MNAVPHHAAKPLPAIPTYIVQAGGQGTRMEHYTWNKPKCLVPIDGKPLLYHLFSAAPDAHFIVIGDYLFDVLKAYIAAFPPEARVTLVKADGKGTCSGMAAAVKQIEYTQSPVGIIWSDLYFAHLPKFADYKKPVIGMSGTFPCRWSDDPVRGLVEEISFDRGVCGYFMFPNASFLNAVPHDGEFVKWLQGTLREYDTQVIETCKEIGNSAMALRQWEHRGYARFFNDVTILADRVEKRARVPALASRIEQEADWYEEVTKRGFKAVPKLLGRNPLTLERIHGKPPCEINLKPREKYALLERLFATMSDLHNLAVAPANAEDCKDIYLTKTVQRVAKMLSLVPNRESPFFTINGRRCRNPFADGDGLAEIVGEVPCDEFRIIHGDPHFSNMLVTPAGDPYLIDPRAMFGKTKCYGDADYDWAKLYYSAVGDFDAFNKRRFRLVVWDTTVSLDIDSAGFSFTKSMFQNFLGEPRFKKIELLHALIWMSFAGWVDDDIDSMIAAFFNGLYWLEEWAQ